MRDVILPKKLCEAVTSTGISGKALQKGIDFIQYLLYKYSTDEQELERTNFINIPSQTLKSFFDRDYNTLFMSIFTQNKIVIRSPFKSGSADGNQCFGYRLNDELMDFNETDIINLPASKTKDKSVDDIDYVINDLRKIEFDIPAMLDYVKNINVANLIKLNKQITEDPIELTPIFSKIKFKTNKPLKDALTLATKFRKDLVEYDNRFFIVRSATFCKWKNIALKSALIYSINKLKNQDFYAGRNETNFRMDTNLTNLKGDFFKNGYLRLDGELIVDIDLKNSQPTLLSFVLSGGIFKHQHFQPIVSGYTFPEIDRTQIDYQLFIQLAESGLLYDHIGTMMGWSRDHAKQNFIKTMFADARWAGSNKMKLKLLFPTVLSWMDQFKMKNNNDLAVLLQRIESRIFIDDIYMKLRAKGFLVYTKHDSILCKQSDQPTIMDEMCIILDTYGFKYRLE